MLIAKAVIKQDISDPSQTRVQSYLCLVRQIWIQHQIGPDLDLDKQNPDPDKPDPDPVAAGSAGSSN